MKIQPRSILEEKIRTIIDDQTYNAYLCGREWPAWEAGTMTKDDFTKFSDSPRFEELVSDIMEAACGSPAKDRCTCDSTKARPGGGVPMCLVCEAELEAISSENAYSTDSP